MTFGPALYIEVIFRLNQVRNVHYVVDAGIAPITPVPNEQNIPTPTPLASGIHTFFGQLTGGDKIEILSPVSAQFGIVIPKIGANSPVFPNVDAGNPDAYLPILTKGVAHAAGTVFPGVNGNIFLFAHSTDNFWNVGRYNAIFYLLKELDNGDEIDVYYGAVRHVYRVVNKLIVNPTDTHYLTDTLPYEQLTLQTCWPPGTTLKRMLIIARPEKDLLKQN